MFIERCPLRVSLVGGGLDYPEIIKRHAVCTLAFTIDKYVHAIVNPLVGCFDYKYRVGYRRQEYGNAIDDITHDVVRESLKYFGIDEYLDIQSLSNIPSIAGLGSSSSFAVALFRCLNRLTGSKLSNTEILNVCIQIERNTNNGLGGIQDQYHAFYPGFNLINYREDKVIQVDNELAESVTKNSMLVLDNRQSVSEGSPRGVGDSWYSNEELSDLISLNRYIKEALYDRRLNFGELQEVFLTCCKSKLRKMIAQDKFSLTPFTGWLLENRIESWKFCGAPGSRAIYILDSEPKISLIREEISNKAFAFEIPFKMSFIT